MTTSQTTSKFTKETKKISRGDLAQACKRSEHQAHNLLVSIIKESGKSQKELSELTGIGEATISRALRRPRNIEIKTLSKLIYAACGAFLTYDTVKPQVHRRRSGSVSDFGKHRNNPTAHTASSARSVYLGNLEAMPIEGVG